MILGVDVGGTFTDFVLQDGSGQVLIDKLMTSVGDPSQAILEGVGELGAGPETTVVHGTTVATNALLERRGARTALVTTKGFRDVLEIGRQTRRDLYALHPTRPPALVPTGSRYELPERVDCRGMVLEPLNVNQLDAVVRQLVAEGIESVAVCFLFSFLNPTHEHLVGERILADRDGSGMHISLSSDILPEYREYERTSTTVINAYVAPLVGRYLGNLQRGLGDRQLRVMQSNGGIISADAARSAAARTALSGPAGGVVGAFRAASQAGYQQAITFDMGGTSTDVSLCPGRVQETKEGSVAGLPLRLPIIDIHTVGAGGGSIARCDAAGALRVGPESAGADPGPVCYGKPQAQELTVTDANLVLGRLDADHFLSGRMQLDLARAGARMQDLARQVSLPLEAAAWGVIRVANSNMERAIRTISVERGHDPRRFTLVAFGGAGPLHACELAASLCIPRVLVPPHPGVLSALGMVQADVVKDYSQTVMVPAHDGRPAVLERHFEPLLRRAEEEMAAEGLGEEVILVRALDMRYVGQSYELTIELREDDFIQEFHQAHRRRFTYATETEPVEIVNVNLKAVARTAKPRLGEQPLGRVDPKEAHVGYKPVYFADAVATGSARPVPSALYQRSLLTPGNIVVGPAVIFQMDTTSVIPPGWAASVNRWGDLVVEQRGM